MLSNFIKSAIRNLFRNKVYSFINIAGLSLGVACAMLILLYLKDEVSYDRFHTNVKNIYRVYSYASMVDADGLHERSMGITGYFQGPHFSAKIPEIKTFVRVQSGAKDMKTGTEVKYQQVNFVDPNFFSVFTFPLLQGDPKTCLTSPDAVVISEDIAAKQFGTTDALGKTILLKGDSTFEPHKVTGIAKRCPQNSSIRFDVLMPVKVSADFEQNNRNWFSFFLNTYVVLNPLADIKKVEAKMDQVYREDAGPTIKMFEKQFGQKDPTQNKLEPFLNLHLDTKVSREDITGASDPLYSWLLSGIVVFILLIACINFINLTVARSIKRAKEIGIRKVIGSNRKQLIFQFLGESFFFCFIAFALAILLVQLLLPLFNELSNKALSVAYLLDVKLVGGYVILFLATGLLAGFYPALVLSNYDPVKTLYNRFSLSGKNYLQKSLVVLQFTFASFLIVATIIIYTQFKFLTTQSLGYDDRNLVLVNKQNLTDDESKLLRAELLKSRDILGVAAKNNGFAFNGGKINGNKDVGFANVAIDEMFLPLLKIPLIEGRNFSAAFPSDAEHSILVNETFVKDAGWKNPIGQTLEYDNNTKYQVIGVVKDYHFRSFSYKIEPEVFFMRPADYGMAYIKVKPGSESAALQHIESTFKKLFPLYPFSFEFKEEENRKNYASEARWKQIMLFGAVLTIFISCIGLFGLSVLSAEKRAKEIGIRKVLGATVTNVVADLSTNFLKLVVLSLIIAMPLAWLATNKWLANYPYHITPGWMIFSGGALLVILIALATVSFQAVKTAVANPVRSLRSE